MGENKIHLDEKCRRDLCALMDGEASDFEVQGVLTTTDRPLQGQSDWLFNLQVGYEPFSGTTATLLYHYFGDTYHKYH